MFTPEHSKFPQQSSSALKGHQRLSKKEKCALTACIFSHPLACSTQQVIPPPCSQLISWKVREKMSAKLEGI